MEVLITHSKIEALANVLLTEIAAGDQERYEQLQNRLNEVFTQLYNVGLSYVSGKTTATELEQSMKAISPFEVLKD